jgi:hypothetical protein
MIKCAKEMIEMMEKHLEEIKNKGWQIVNPMV